MSVKNKVRPTCRTWKPTAEDEKLVQEIKAKLGVTSVSDIVRMGLRKLAESHGLLNQ
jgi:hypothetical protein